jgi:hypothetical protein
MADSTSKPYDGPIFDVQAHAIKPSSYDAVVSAVRTTPSLTDGSVDVITNDVCKNLADDLHGDDRIKALGGEGAQIVTVNTFFPTLPPQMMLKIVDDLKLWMSSKSAGNSQLTGTASIPSPPFLTKAGLSSDGQTYVEKGIIGLRFAIGSLDLKGIMFGSNHDGVFLVDATFDPYFRPAE